MSRSRSGAWTGWIVFAGTMLVVVGMLNAFEGLVALLADERVVATANNFVVVDLTSWGWTLVISGLLMVLVGGGLLVGQSWARITAIVIVGLHAVIQVAWIGAYPLWSLLMIALDTVVIFALTARWPSTQDGAVDWEDRGRSYERPVREPVPPAT